VVSKAVGNAVARNRVKRRLRHLVRARLAALPRGSVLVVRALPPAAESSSARLAIDLETALHRLGAGATAVPASSA
jgi:ribonuclease P protein component